MFNDLEPMLLLFPFIAFLLLLLAYSWINNNNNYVKEPKKEPKRDPKELAPAWLMIILHGLSELHAKVALEVQKIVKFAKISLISKTFVRYLKYSKHTDINLKKGAPAQRQDWHPGGETGQHVNV